MARRTTSHTPFQVVYGRGDPNFNAHNNEIGAYLQDDWTPMQRLTINLGVRWDYESHMLNYDYVTPKNVVDTLTRYNNQLPTPLDLNRYISNGNNRYPYLRRAPAARGILVRARPGEQDDDLRRRGAVLRPHSLRRRRRRDAEDHASDVHDRFRAARRHADRQSDRLERRVSHRQPFAARRADRIAPANRKRG